MVKIGTHGKVKQVPNYILYIGNCPCQIGTTEGDLTLANRHDLQKYSAYHPWMIRGPDGTDKVIYKSSTAEETIGMDEVRRVSYHDGIAWNMLVIHGGMCRARYDNNYLE